METVEVSLFEPQMPIVHDRGRLYHTGLENGTATIKRSGFEDLVVDNVIIQPTPVTRSLLHLPVVATVAPCVAKDGNDIVVSELPAEKVVLTSLDPFTIVAKEMLAKTTFTDPRDGEVFVGMVKYPDCHVDLWAGGASALTATGTLNQVPF